MHTDILQPWVTIQATSPTVNQVVQEEEGWLDLSGCSDVAIWLDVRAVTAATGSSSVTLLIESSPTKDEAFFLPVAEFPLLAASRTPVVVKTISGSAAANPVARWLRWRLGGLLSGDIGTWSATFRVRVARSRTAFFSPAQIPGCQFWFRADMGVSLSSSAGSSNAVTVWDDLSGRGSNMMSSVTPQLLPGTFNNQPAIEFGYKTVSYLTTTTGITVPQPSSLLLVGELLGTSSVQDYVYGGGAAPVSVASGSGTNLTLNAGTSQTVALGTSMAGSGPQILQVDWSGIGSHALVYQNGVLQGTANPGTNALTLAALGATSTGGNNLFGYLAEVLCFYPLLTPSWRTLVTRYLGSRYGIVVP